MFASINIILNTEMNLMLSTKFKYKAQLQFVIKQIRFPFSSFIILIYSSIWRLRKEESAIIIYQIRDLIDRLLNYLIHQFIHAYAFIDTILFSSIFFYQIIFILIFISFFWFWFIILCNFLFLFSLIFFLFTFICW